MKKYSLIFLITLVFILFSSCSTTPEVVEDLDNDFYAFKAEINADRLAEYKIVYDYSDLKKFLVDNSSDKNALTSSEINTLKNKKNKNLKVLSYEQMVEDVDLYFRVLRSHWGAYYYWGGNKKFNSVKQSILDKFKGKTSILSDDLESVMHEAMNFIVDGHFQLGSGEKAHFVSDENKYWFCYTDDVFLKDEDGFYCDKEGKRYYWVGCDNADVSMQRRLFDDGTLGYGIIQFTPKAFIHDSDEIVLLCEGQEIKTTVKWTRSKPLSEDSLRNPSFKLVKSNGVSYLRLYSFNPNYVDQLEAFAKSGTSARGSGLLIFDIRSNGGGNSRYLNEWFNSYTGLQHDIKVAIGKRNGDLNNSGDNSQAYSYHASQGTIINHKAPVIVLVDNNCGSSGETAYNALRTIKNSIVIGTNTSGCESFGNSVEYVLPNSGIRFVYGTHLRSFSDPMENVDGKGFLPDIWCNPSTALTAVQNMLIKYNIVNEETLVELMDKINQTSVTITMMVEGDVVNDGSGFGRGSRQFYVYILANGEQISDYEYSVKDNIGSITKRSNGALTFKATKAGDATITIKYKGNTAKFRWHVSNEEIITELMNK